MVTDEMREKLRGLQSRAAAAVSVRAAMRVLPLLAMRGTRRTEAFSFWPSSQGRHCLAIFQCYQTSTYSSSLRKVASVPAATRFMARTYSARAAAAADIMHRPHADRLYPNGVASAVNAAARAAAAADPDIYAADAATVYAADAADAVRAAKDADSALRADIEAARQSGAALLTRPLWPEIPAQVSRLWATLRDDLIALDEGFEIWIDWYEDGLSGTSRDLLLERRWALLPDDILDQSHLKLTLI